MIDNNTYYAIHNELQKRYDAGEITLMEANKADKAAYDKYADKITIESTIDNYIR